ncbi:hypothetical protein PR048_022803 [Dryococelus australis]|uniref:Uncharacterized protein n=1 Tax=Dryococelus australis TaxID=614101 RepID=A0ABQ9GSA5_9NEOP|nr:hypothetical protein PR048_022803 [Dryococelus australis]
MQAIKKPANSPNLCQNLAAIFISQEQWHVTHKIIQHLAALSSASRQDTAPGRYIATLEYFLTNWCNITTTQQYSPPRNVDPWAVSDTLKQNPEDGLVTQTTQEFIFGVASEGTCLLVPSYLRDENEDDIKGQLRTLYALSIGFGTTLDYYLSYTAFNTCNAKEARIALRWLIYGQETETEMDRLQARADDTLKKRQAKLTISYIMDRITIRGILINLNLTYIRYLCGVNAVMAYAVIIFQEASSTIESHIARITAGVLSTICTIFSSFVIDKSGRRSLLNWGWDLEYVGWIPLACLRLYDLLHGFALSPLPSAIVNETVIVHARGAVQSLCNIIGSVIYFGVVISYSILTDVTGEHGATIISDQFCRRQKTLLPMELFRVCSKSFRTDAIRSERIRTERSHLSHVIPGSLLRISHLLRRTSSIHLFTVVLWTKAHESKQHEDDPPGQMINKNHYHKALLRLRDYVRRKMPGLCAFSEWNLHQDSDPAYSAQLLQQFLDKHKVLQDQQLLTIPVKAFKACFLERKR